MLDVRYFPAAVLYSNSMSLVQQVFSCECFDAALKQIEMSRSEMKIRKFQVTGSLHD